MSDILYTSWGKLHYTQPDGTATINGKPAKVIGYKLVAEVDQNIVNLYRALMPKYIQVNPQMYPAHISVVRKELPPNLEHWGKYEGEVIEFQYSPIVHHGTIYYWLNCFSRKLEEIRIELGLPVSSEYTRPPDSFEKIYHCTLGNVKSND